MLPRSYSTSAPTTKMFIDGKFVESKTTEYIDLFDPATNELVTKVPKCTDAEMQEAVDSSKKAFKVRVFSDYDFFHYPNLNIFARHGAKPQFYPDNKLCSNYNISSGTICLNWLNQSLKNKGRH